jgi:hypothetical protein
MSMAMSIDARALLNAWMLFAVGFAPLAHSSEAPYPQSTIITGITWDFSQVAAQRAARGSDIWPITWGADDKLYTAWGDGGGFGGTDSQGRVSIGFASIQGVPDRQNSATFEGHNIWGAAPSFAEHQAHFGGKIQSMLAVCGVLYAYGGIWTRENCDCPDPTKLDGDGPKKARALAWSKDAGRTWTLSSWRSANNVYFLNFGKDNWEARDEFIYEYYLRPGDSTNIYLKRIAKRHLTAHPNSRAYRFLTRLDPRRERAHWSAHEHAATPVFHDPQNVALPQVIYNAALGRYLLAVGHNPGAKRATLSAGQLGLFEAPNPWGPWATIDYQDDWGNLGPNATGAFLGLHIPTKWISDDGTHFWAVFSNLREFDSFNIVGATLTVSDGVPKLTTPNSGTTLVAGKTYSASAAASGPGNSLSWTASLPGRRPLQFAHGTGASFTFEIPSDVEPGHTVRLTVQTPQARVYRDFAIQNATHR